jgi:NADH-quinone oxidoreductase subunit J
VTVSRIVFYALAALTVLGAIGVVTRRNVVHSAILLIATLMGVAGIYLVLEAEFLAAVQVLVYAGGVMVLFLFVIMLVDLEQRGKPPAGKRRLSRTTIVGGAVLSVLLLGLLLSVFAGQALGPASPGAGEVLRENGGNLGAVAMSMFRFYLVPFELASILLLVAMVGAVVLARARQ